MGQNTELNVLIILFPAGSRVSYVPSMTILGLLRYHEATKLKGAFAHKGPAESIPRWENCNSLREYKHVESIQE